MLENVRSVDSVQEWWEQRRTTILRVGHEVLSITCVMPCRGMADAIFAVRQRVDKKGRRTLECLGWIISGTTCRR